MSQFIVAALYKFVSLPDFEDLRQPLQKVCDSHQVKGTLLLAKEGINGTISGSREGIDAVVAYLKSDSRLSDLDHKESLHEEPPFHRMKVKLKREIVTMGVEGIDPKRAVGAYVEPKAWNELISDPEVLVVDTRNDYEYEVGTFERAVNPNTRSFREFPDYVKRNLDPQRHKKVAMFCTGGIRCEKATSYMLEQGFEEVYHLKGGILKYLEEVESEQSLWKGECFVFDNRVTVNHELQAGEYDMCHGCRRAITDDDKASPKYQAGVSCPHCYADLTEEQKQRFAERQKQMELAKARGEKHIGVKAPQHQMRDDEATQQV